MNTVYFYEDEAGNCPVQEFLDARTENENAKAAAWIEQLQIQGPTLPRPYADFLRDGIHELRIKLKGDQVRILYYFVFQDNIILTNAFIKNVDKVPDAEIETALKCKADFEKRYPNKEALKEAMEEEN